jgi:two-component system OmpR family sensor kinase
MAARSTWLPRRPLSMRARLLWTFLVPLAVVLVLVGVVATAALHQQLVHQVDARLSGAVGRTSTAAGEYGRPAGGGHDYDDHPDILGARGQGAGTLGARIVDGTATQAGVVTERGSDEALSPAQAHQLVAVPVDGNPRTVDLGGSVGEYRVVATTAPDGDVLVTGLPLDSTNTAVAKLMTVEVAAGLAGLLITALAGGIVVQRTLRPLTHVAATAARVTELPLASGEVVLPERVPEADTDPRTEVGRVGTALNRLLDHVESSLHARQASEMQVRQFVADASHELRTPLASIRGYAELAGRYSDRVPPDVSHAMRRIQSESMRMTSLVEELLLLARLDAGRPLASVPVDLSRLVVDAVSDARVTSRNHRWQLAIPGEPVTVLGDGQALHQVLLNLLGNARAHTPAGTTVVTGIGRGRPGEVVLTVADNGPGIPVALQPEVFERFARGDGSRSRASGGTGLGLSIVAAIVTAHGGEVVLDSRPGRTVFTVRLTAAAQ